TGTTTGTTTGTPTDTAPDPATGTAPAEQPPQDPVAGPVPSGPAAPVPSSGPVATGSTTAQATPSAVTQQVFDRIERLVVAGDGTHRISLRLDPGTLGEVRLMLTVRAGRVSVRIAADDEARRALVHGAPELQRLLESQGAGDVRVNVRSLTAAPQPGPPSWLTHDLPGSPMGSADTGSGTGHQGTAAWTRDAATATDGHRGRVVDPGPVQPSRSAPPVGVDVRM
ncbi:flagellar hook-length control protein FliK, partial [Nocardioides sp.]|uniref:flagellar hook-length control protein FliK n=1 Tax=Nocardioides sp. TaxID=35761 RepID=UPI001A2E5A6D